MKVLIIDDDKFIRAVYEAELRQEDFAVELAEDGESGFEKAKEVKPDLILLDMILPGKSGFEILGELKASSELKKIPVIVFSSLSQPSDISEAKKLGCLKYLPKDSYSPRQIVREIKKILIKN